jgi:hypothetical protein
MVPHMLESDRLRRGRGLARSLGYQSDRAMEALQTLASERVAERKGGSSDKLLVS